MKTLISILVIAALLTTTSSGQEYSTDFGRVTKAEYELTQYRKDPAAEAVVLYDIGDTQFRVSDGQFLVVYERRTRIKVFTEGGTDHAEIEIPVYREGSIYEKVYDLEGFTYNYRDGKVEITRLDSDNVFEEEVNEYWVVKKFSLPAVKPGSIFEYRYKVTSQHKFQLRDWHFQRRIPTIYSHYQIKMVPFYEYVCLITGNDQIDHKRSYVESGFSEKFHGIEYKHMVHEYEMTDIPALKDEQYITSVDDYLYRLQFQLSKVYQLSGASNDIQTTWEDMIRDYLKDYGYNRYIGKFEKLSAKLVDESELAGLGPEETIAYLNRVIKANFRWNGKYRKYIDGSPKDLMKNKTGDCAELNLALTGLLRAAGFEAHPVLLSTRDHGKIVYDYPFENFFNYVVVAIKHDGDWILTDATEPACENLSIPPRCINDKGLLLQQDKVEWVRLENNMPGDRTFRYSIAIRGDSLRAAASLETSGYESYAFRKRYGDNKSRFAGRFDDGLKVDTATVQFRNLEEPDQPFVIGYDLESELSQIGERIFLDPFFGEVPDKNPLSESERTYPIDMTYPRRRSFFVQVNIPEGYRVEHLPEKAGMKDDNFEFVFSVGESGEKLEIYLMYHFKKPVYPASQLNVLRFYFNELIDKGNEKVVLVKG